MVRSNSKPKSKEKKTKVERKTKSVKKVLKKKSSKKIKLNSEKNIRDKNLFSINEFKVKKLENKKSGKEIKENEKKDEIKNEFKIIKNIQKEEEKKNIIQNKKGNINESFGENNNKRNDYKITKKEEKDEKKIQESSEIENIIKKADKLIKKEKNKLNKKNSDKNGHVKKNKIEEEKIKIYRESEINNLIKNQILQNEEKLIENEKQNNLLEFRKRQKELLAKMNKEKLLKEKELVNKEIARKEEIIRKMREKKILNDKKQENDKQKLENAKRVMRNRRMIKDKKNIKKIDEFEIFEKKDEVKEEKKLVDKEQEFFEDNLLFKKEISEEARKKDLSSKKNIEVPKQFIKKSKRNFKKINKNKYNKKHKLLENKNILKKNYEDEKLKEKINKEKNLEMKKMIEYKIENKFDDYNPIENPVYTPKENSKNRKYSTKFKYKKKEGNNKKKEITKIQKDHLNDSLDFDNKKITKNDFNQNLSHNDISKIEHDEISDNELKEDKKNDKTLLNIIFTKNNKNKRRIEGDDKISIVDLSNFEDDKSQKKSYNKKIKRRKRRNSDKSDFFSKDEVSCINIKNKKFDGKSRITKIEDKLKKEIRPENELKQFSTIYKENLISLQKLLKRERFNKALDLLYWMLSIEQNQRKIDTFKSLGIVHYKKKQYEKSIIILFRGIEYLNEIELQNKLSYKKTFLINIAISQIANNQPQNALNCLIDPAFDDKENQPFAYLTLLGDSYFMINKFLDAFDSYNEQLSKFTKNLLSDKLIEHIYNICNKIVMTLIKNKDELLFVKFYKYLVDTINRMIETVEAYSGNQNYSFFKNNTFLNLIILVHQEKDENLLNYLLNSNINDKIINIHELEEIQNKKLLEILLDFTSMLKKIENYGNQKKSYGKVLEYSINIMESMDKDLKKEKLLTFFNLGTFYLENNNFKKAQNKIENCLSLYKENFGNCEQQLFTILYSIGEKVYLKKKYKESCFYFEKILEMDSEKQKKSDSMKYLLKAYYIIGDYQKGINLLESLLIEKIEENSEDLFFLISIFFILCMKAHSKKFGDIMKSLKNYNDFYQNYENTHYLFLYYNLSQYYFKKKNLLENKRLLKEFEDLDSRKNFESNIVDKMDQIYNRIIMENRNENKNIFCCLFDKKLDLKKNSKKMESFIKNFYFVFINGIKIITKSVYDLSTREKILKNTLSYKSKIIKQIERKLKTEINIPKMKMTDHDHEIGPIDVFYIGKSTRTVQSRIFSMRDMKDINSFASKRAMTIKTNTCKSINLSQSPDIKKKNFFKKNNYGSVRDNFNRTSLNSKKKILNNFGSTKNVYKNGKNKSIRSMRFSNNITKSQNLEKTDNLRMSQNFKTQEEFKFKEKCDCDGFVDNNNLISQIVFMFFENLENITEFKSLKNITFYYKKFNWNLEQFKLKKVKKFIYINKIINFFENDKKTQKENFMNFIGDILDDNLCYHDMKNILIILEANKNIFLVEDFILVLEEKNENLFKKLIQKMFFEDLDKTINKIRNFFYKKINHKKKNFIYTSSFYHLTNYPRLSKYLKIVFNFSFYKKKRFDIFNNKIINRILKNNFFEENLSKFNFNLNFFTSILDLNKYKKNSEIVLKNYEKKLKSILSEFSQLGNPTKNFYNFYLLINFINFSENEKNEKISEKILEIINILKKKQKCNIYIIYQ